MTNEDKIKCPNCNQWVHIDEVSHSIQRKVVKGILRNPGKLAGLPCRPVALTIGGIVDEEGRELFEKYADKVDGYLYGNPTYICSACKCYLKLDENDHLVKVLSKLDKVKQLGNMATKNVILNRK